MYVKSWLFLYGRFANVLVHKKQRVRYKEIHMNNVKYWMFMCVCTGVCVCGRERKIF